MATLDDWEVLLALHHHERQWDGLITTDSGMLSLPRELAVLLQTKLTLVVVKEAGHDPLKATGLLLAYLPSICGRIRGNVAQLWTLQAAQPPHRDPWEEMQRLARRARQDPNDLYQGVKLSSGELARNPLGDE